MPENTRTYTRLPCTHARVGVVSRNLQSRKFFMKLTYATDSRKYRSTKNPSIQYSTCTAPHHWSWPAPVWLRQEETSWGHSDPGHSPAGRGRWVWPDPDTPQWLRGRIRLPSAGVHPVLVCVCVCVCVFT